MKRSSPEADGLAISLRFLNTLPKPSGALLFRMRDPTRWCQVLSPGASQGPLLHDEELKAEVADEVRESATKKMKLEEETEAFHREAFPFQNLQLLTNDIFTERQRFTTGQE
eukprot:278398-Amphidinium_carterae.1